LIKLHLPYQYISALEMASPRSRRCANCIGTLSFPGALAERCVGEGMAVHHRSDVNQFSSPDATRQKCVVSSCRVVLDNFYSEGSPYSITERRVPELIPFLGTQPAGDVSHKPGGRLPLLSARPAVTLASLKRAATSFAVW